MLILTIVILLMAAAVSFLYFSYNDTGSANLNWLGETGVFPMSWIPYIIGILILILFTAWVLSFVLTMPKRLRRSGQLRSLNKSRNSLDKGLMQINSGDFEAGEASLTSYLEGTPADAVKYVTAAKSAISRGADAQAEQYLKKAGDVSNNAGEAVRLTQAEMLMQRGEYKDAETLLTNLNNSKPRNAHVLTQLAKALVATGNAKKLTEVTRVMRSKTNIPKDTVREFERSAWTTLIGDADDSDVVHTFELLPKESRRDEDAVAAFADRLMAKGDHQKAANTLQHAINSNWSEKLVEVYGRVKLADTSKLLDQANSWLDKHPASPALALTIGRLSSSRQLWGKAKESLVKAAQMDLSPAVCTELGEVLTGMGDSKNAKDCFQSAAAIATGKPPVGILRDLDSLGEQLTG